MGTRHGLLLLLVLAFLLVSPSPAEAQFYGPVAAWEYPYCSDGSFYDPWFGCLGFWGGGGFVDGMGCWCGLLTCSCGPESGMGFRSNCFLSQRRSYFVRAHRSWGPPDMEGRLATQQRLPWRGDFDKKHRGSVAEARARPSPGGDRASGSRGGGREGSRGQSGSRGSSGTERGGGRQGGGHQGGGGAGAGGGHSRPR